MLKLGESTANNDLKKKTNLLNECFASNFSEPSNIDVPLPNCSDLGLDQWRRHHRGRGGSLPPLSPCRGGIATPEICENFEISPTKKTRIVSTIRGPCDLYPTYVKCLPLLNYKSLKLGNEFLLMNR